MPTEQEKQQLIKDHYRMAYQIAYNFNAPYIDDSVKENLALKALNYAAEHYNPNRGARFASFLHLCVLSWMKEEATRLKRLPRCFSHIVDRETQERKDIFETFTEPSYEEKDLTMHEKISSELEKRLSPRQQKILDMFLAPQVYLEYYIDTYKPAEMPRKLTYDVMSKMLGISGGMITFELHKIREITQGILERVK